MHTKPGTPSLRLSTSQGQIRPSSFSSRVHTRACSRLQHRRTHPLTHPPPLHSAAQLREVERQPVRVELDTAKPTDDEAMGDAAGDGDATAES